MKLNRIILTTITSIFYLTLSAQKIAFDKQTVNTGNTIWKEPVTATFRFTNKGKTPLTIKNVDAGCGCISAKWTNGTLDKGQSGEIKLTYDAKLLGHYDRIVEVFTNLGEKPERLRVKGVITSGKLQDFEDTYPFCVDDIYLSTSSVEFKEVNKGDSTKTYIEIYNGSHDVYTPTLMHLPAYITAKAQPEMLARGRKGRIELTLHGDQLNDLGLNQTNIYLARYSGDMVRKENEISLSAILLPDKDTNNNRQMPGLEVSTKKLNLGKIGKKSNLKGTITITNNGNAPLSIDRVQAFNQAIMVNLAKSEIAPGKSVKMKITVQAKYLGMSKAQPRVLLITNDPRQPMEVITINFE